MNREALNQSGRRKPINIKNATKTTSSDLEGQQKTKGTFLAGNGVASQGVAEVTDCHLDRRKRKPIGLAAAYRVRR